MMQPQLHAALAVAQGEEPAQAHRKEFPVARARAFGRRRVARGGAGVRARATSGPTGAACTPGDEPSRRPTGGRARRSSRKASAARRRGRARRERAERGGAKVQHVLDSLRRQVEMIGSVGAAFRKLEVSGDAKISSEELRNALKSRFQIEMSDETTRRVLREFDENGDGEIEYREFVGRLLGGKDIDTEGSRQGATGGGGKNVAMAVGEGGRAPRCATPRASARSTSAAPWRRALHGRLSTACSRATATCGAFRAMTSTGQR